MPILVVLIVCSIAFYLFYKIKTFRSTMPMEKKWLSGKSSMAIGLFVALFGINQLFLFQTTTTFLVAAIFIIVGLLSIIGGYKIYRHYLPYALNEAKAAADQLKG